MDRADYNKFMMRSVARDLLASLVFRPIMQHMTPYNINKVPAASTRCACCLPFTLQQVYDESVLTSNCYLALF